MNPFESSYSCASLNSPSKPVCPAITVTWDSLPLSNQLVFSPFPRQKFCKVLRLLSEMAISTYLLLLAMSNEGPEIGSGEVKLSTGGNV